MLVAVLLAPLAFSPCDFTNTNKGAEGQYGRTNVP